MSLFVKVTKCFRQKLSSKLIQKLDENKRRRKKSWQRSSSKDNQVNVRQKRQISLKSYKSKWFTFNSVEQSLCSNLKELVHKNTFRLCRCSDAWTIKLEDH